MGYVQTIDYDKFPEQGSWKGRRCKVCFNYGSETIWGVIVRDDREPPNRTIIQLDDGRFILASECQFQLERLTTE